MDGATLQAKIYAGRAKAAAKIGLSCNVFRPALAVNPMTNRVATLPVAFNARDLAYKAPSEYGQALWYADMDGTQTQPGDYLVRVSDGAIWFVAAQQQLLPIVTVECPRKLYCVRQEAVTAVGAVGYGGLQPANDVDALGNAQTPWPCSILTGGRALTGPPLPADVKQGGWRILLPPSVPITLAPSDILVDDLGRRFIIESAELSELGWRINANEAHD